MLQLIIFLSSASLVMGYANFTSQIPNGDSVPNPCDGGTTTWNGVGHWRPGGGGPRNPFGEAFAAAGYEWTEALCRADSDGDGKSNGEELGDLRCQWDADNPDDPSVHLQDATGHPGICEPIDSDVCTAIDAQEHNLHCNNPPVGRK